MPTHPISGASSPLSAASGTETAPDRWTPPTVEVICLACEISAYAPDGDLPLF
jgi:hypothetical protein